MAAMLRMLRGIEGLALWRWEGLTLGQADRLDPVLSGQVLSHLAVPELDGEEGAGDSNGV